LDAIARKIGTPTDILIAIIGKALEIIKTPVTGHFERVGKGSNELLREQL